MTETLVCVSREHVESLGLGEGFTALDADSVCRLLTPEAFWLGPRSHLETDEGFRQLVSYVVVRCRDLVLTYRRTPKGGESRLHGRISVGVGGHWNVGDVVHGQGAIDTLATQRRACERELDEEVRVSELDRTQIVGVIKETGNPVSRVHLGVVVECWVRHTDVTVLDPGLQEARFVNAAELQILAPEMETWSSSLMTYLSAS